MKVLPNISLIFSKSIRVNHWRRFLQPPFRPNGARVQWTTPCLSPMSANVLKQPYKDQYINVYQRSLIGMCLDIIIREKSKEKRHSWFDAKLANEYGVSKPFNDNELLLKYGFNLSWSRIFSIYVAGTTLFHTKLTLQSGCYKIYCKIA
jgi:hypothetical protein